VAAPSNEALSVALAVVRGDEAGDTTFGSVRVAVHSSQSEAEKFENVTDWR
jgi:hypothetical protein